MNIFERIKLEFRDATPHAYAIRDDDTSKDICADLDLEALQRSWEIADQKFVEADTECRRLKHQLERTAQTATAGEFQSLRTRIEQLQTTIPVLQRRAEHTRLKFEELREQHQRKLDEEVAKNEFRIVDAQVSTLHNRLQEQDLNLTMLPPQVIALNSEFNEMLRVRKVKMDRCHQLGIEVAQ